MTVKQGFKYFGLTLLGIVIVLILLAFTEQGSMLVQRWIYPQQLQVQRIVVENSKSYTDSKNTQLMNLIKEYTALDSKIYEGTKDPLISSAYRSQQKAILNQMCYMLSTMAEGTVNPIIVRFISSNGGCY
jgi:hypothetical protein